MMRTLAHVVSCFTDAFGYDALGQVVSARFGEGADPDLYDYDPIGNFTSNRLRNAWTQFDANELNEYATLSTPLTSSTPSTSSTTALSYDLDGNLLTNGVWSYAYDSMNRLSAAASNGVAVAEYAYDAFWRRVGRRVCMMLTFSNPVSQDCHPCRPRHITMLLITTAEHGPGIEFANAWRSLGETCFGAKNETAHFPFRSGHDRNLGRKCND